MPVDQDDLLAEFKTRGKPGPKCQVGRLAETLATADPTRFAKLDAALAAPEIQHSRICEVLRGWGYPVNKDAVARHRRRATGTGCSCD